jgi:hypothetical protein
LISSLVGDAEQVAGNLAEFADLGTDRIALMSISSDSHAAIAPFLDHRQPWASPDRAPWALGQSSS